MRTLLLTIALSLATLWSAQAKRSSVQLEQRLIEIDCELQQLANFSLRSGAGANGYRSRPHDVADSSEWIEVDLNHETSIDEIMLVPTLLRDTNNGFQADGFPSCFRIVVGTADNTNGTVIASFTEEDHLLPRVAPVSVPCAGVRASWVRIEATQLTARGIDGRFTFQLAEILVFKGTENMALRCNVKMAQDDASPRNTWGARFITDGSFPYLLDAATGKKGIAYMNSVGTKDHPAITVDLETPFPLKKIVLHAMDQSDTIPQSFEAGFGVPRHLTVLGAMRTDFTDAMLLLDVHLNSLYDINPILSWNIPETSCRYVRFIATEPYIYDDGRNVGSRIGFAEIELFSGTTNVALHKPVSSNDPYKLATRPIENLTDGLNFYGHILPTHEWLSQLKRRHDLESERPKIAHELNNRYTRQKTNLMAMYWLAALLIVGIGFTILWGRLVRIQQIERMKERFAADLHDELGANLHTISLLSDLVVRKCDILPENIAKLLHRIRAISKQSGMAVRYFINMQDANDLYTELQADMQRAAERIVVDLQHDLTIDGGEFLNHLQAQTRVDLLLFYKECLVNICRHSGATQLSTHLTATERTLRLDVSDNGTGITAEAAAVPPSLKRRAHLLGAHLDVSNAPNGGTCIQLTLSTRKFRFKK